MIIVGDIASPSETTSQDLQRVFEVNSHVFGRSMVLANLEGMISDKVSLTSQETPVLYNHPSVLEAFRAGGVKAVGLANNHTLDLPHLLDATKKHLREARISFGGAGTSFDDAQAPFSFIDKGKEVFVLNACWNFLLYHQENPTGGTYLSELDEFKLLAQVSAIKKQHSAAAQQWWYCSIGVLTLRHFLFQ
jgi:hypothetical protein